MLMKIGHILRINYTTLYAYTYTNDEKKSVVAMGPQFYFSSGRPLVTTKIDVPPKLNEYI